MITIEGGMNELKDMVERQADEVERMNMERQE
jgi:hypothetical protein